MWVEHQLVRDRVAQFAAIHSLQGANPKSARAWCLKLTRRLGYQEAGASNSEEIVQAAMSKCLC